MKNIKTLMIALLISGAAFNCSDDDDNAVTPIGEATIDFSGTYTQDDQMGRPAINTVFSVGDSQKNTFNTTVPSAQGPAFQSSFETRLLALNGAYTTNALGLNAEDFTGVLATDVLSVDLDGVTTFFDGTNVLTGRTLADDVIDTELLLIFGGPMGTDNPTLTTDYVAGNDKDFLTSFPYLATPH
ncbi:uncharacterized protein DUF4331 [Lacinutrix venerupis]|uniref:DUF4331 domain-containing protein n=1 Tax=Lacinutrix venerupis TaxID=1486034 RepID=A0AAC9PWI0_9FLAO|nr:DUF4331 family protein [Lacinutrix venerupis]APX99782.1 hypothetical protein BWR22_05480 [Lacinutrix venerupis]RLJ62447.1 uncharacterized protein DUF4331 [Lacinutrix venerupis]